MHYNDAKAFFVDLENNAIDISAAAVKQMVQVIAFRYYRATSRIFAEAPNGGLQPVEPRVRSSGPSSVDLAL